MKKAGRYSTEALTQQIVPRDRIDALEAIPRPDPPDAFGLTNEETSEWWAVVNGLPADWFRREMQGILAQYCRHVVRGHHLASLIRAMEEQIGKPEFDMRLYRAMISADADNSRVIAVLGTKMRMTQQSTLEQRTVKPPSPLKKRPWD
jgi:hypothetical protein